MNICVIYYLINYLKSVLEGQQNFGDVSFKLIYNKFYIFLVGLERFEPIFNSDGLSLEYGFLYFVIV